MKKACLFMLLCINAAFAELRVIETPIKGTQGIFIGVGLGVGANALIIKNPPFPTSKLTTQQDQSLASFVASAQVGGYYYFTPIIGLRYYYNFDYNATNFGEVFFYDTFYSAYGLSTSHTLNADALYTVFAQDRWSVDVIGGIGLGAITGNFRLKEGDLLFQIPAGVNNNDLYLPIADHYMNFDFRVNLGARVMFNRQYGIELMARLPVIHSNIFKLPNSLSSGKTFSIDQAPYYFTINFIVEKF